MAILLIVVLIAILLLLQFYSKSSKLIYFRKLMLPLGLTCFLLCLVFFSDTAVNSAKKGLDLWFNIVFPSLFPFFVVSELLGSTGFIRAIGVLMEPVMRPLFNVPGCGSFAFAMGITSGYPVGAKITSSMREERLLTKTEAERLLAFTNNSGPLFIVGAVAVGMLNKPELGIFLLLCHIISCITVGILFRFYKAGRFTSGSSYDKRILFRFKSEMIQLGKNISSNFGEMLGNAIKNSIMTILSIGGFIILFSVIINLLLATGIIETVSAFLWLFLHPIGIDKNLISAVLSGLFEITSGANMVSKVRNLDLPVQLASISFVIGWAGLSVHSQVLSIVSKSDISIKPYLLGKFLQGLISALYTFLGIKIAGILFINSKPAFSSFSIISVQRWDNCFSFSLICILFSLLIVTVLVALSLVRIIFFKKRLPFN